MSHKIGDSVRLRPGAESGELLGEAAELTGTVGDAWTDEFGEHISVVYEPVQIYAYGVPAGDFVPDRALAAAPF